MTVAPASPQAPGAAEGEAAAAPGAVRGAEGTALPPPGSGPGPGVCLCVCVCAGGVRARLTPLSPTEAQAAARGCAAGAAGAAGCVRTVRGPEEAAVGVGIPGQPLLVLLGRPDWKWGFRGFG